MENKKNIVWLASYPKSGNTWFRSFISALRNKGEVDINAISTEGIFSQKRGLEECLDLDADEIPVSKMDQFKRISFVHQSNTSAKKCFVKIHDLYSMSKIDHQPIVPEESTLAAIYFVRNPLDVTISMANHNGQTLDETIAKVVCNEHANLVRSEKHAQDQFQQYLGTWNMHVESWKKVTAFPVIFIRYEDMKKNPQDSFSQALKQIEYEATEEEIQLALEASQFEKLKNQEVEFGFREKPKACKSFFNKGEVGQWKEQLNQVQINKIRQFNEPMMREFGYWEE
ncbi:sulfotransferase domain-containing protein [Aquirufa salirivi]|uniref:Sulfotransferase domain-containing protein n=1 Tax=Aquirufa salirivi TaxID=3104729 RepID=A0ABW8RYJ7_9BACT